MNLNVNKDENRPTDKIFILLDAHKWEEYSSEKIRPLSWIAAEKWLHMDTDRWMGYRIIE